MQQWRTGLEAFRRGGVDLVLTDLIMPGVEAAEYGDRVVHMRDGQIVAPDEDPQWSPHHPAEHLQS